MDRRAFVSLFAAIPAVMAIKHYKTVSIVDMIKKPKRAPIDTDDREYDDWLSKDEMHLD
jgi:hypothetical protein